MNKWIGLGFLMILLQGCTVFRQDTGSIDLNGTWEETWDPGKNSSVSYHDHYLIHQRGETITMSSPNRPTYTFSHIHLTDRNFTFQLTNPDDPADIYVIAYNLMVDKSGTFMKGTALTNKGVEAVIELKRIKAGK